jgi:predicted enzyme related to lactoylglutathione lyase
MVRDVACAIQFYATLGFALAGTDSLSDPKYARVGRDGIELHLQWHDAREWDHSNDPLTYRFVVLEVDELHRQFRERAGVTDITPVSDTPWHTREFHLRDPDLNGLQFYRSTDEA